MGGDDGLRAPAQRLADFLRGQPSDSLPRHSYRSGQSGGCKRRWGGGGGVGGGGGGAPLMLCVMCRGAGWGFVLAAWISSTRIQSRRCVANARSGVRLQVELRVFHFYLNFGIHI